MSNTSEHSKRKILEFCFLFGLHCIALHCMHASTRGSHQGVCRNDTTGVLSFLLIVIVDMGHWSVWSGWWVFDLFACFSCKKFDGGAYQCGICFFLHGFWCLGRGLLLIPKRARPGFSSALEDLADIQETEEARAGFCLMGMLGHGWIVLATAANSKERGVLCFSCFS